MDSKHQRQFRELVEQVVAEQKSKRQSVLKEFRHCGDFEMEEALTNGLADRACIIDWHDKPCWPSLLYLFVINSVVKYVGETGNGTRRFFQYARDYGNASHGSTVSNLIWNVLCRGQRVEVWIKEIATTHQDVRRHYERHLIRLFGTLQGQGGWNQRRW